MPPSKSRRSKRASRKKPGSSVARSDAPGAWFERLVALQARLRAPGGCPWDREQTHASLRTYLIEEAYEVLDALESGSDAKFAEELGDLLLQVVFHAQIAREEGRFTISDVIREIHEKMVRRHPHVFGEKRARDAAEVLKNWEQIKSEERKALVSSGDSSDQKAPASLLDGIPHTLPAMMEGFQLTRRASRIGFDWENPEGVLDKLAEESSEVRAALQDKFPRAIEEEIGDLLFAAVNLARFLGVDPEIALKAANAKFAARFREMESAARADGSELAAVPRQEMEELWNRAKQRPLTAKKSRA
ncbi:MAG TPA: nucleoside triphosphate pyrophosphohydrolase [Candidatus Acidoferrum sp.]|nr:nucleoside triphosphate pyrophosphohydrolase [Candidatus Acidoferrum sp.]